MKKSSTSFRLSPETKKLLEALAKKLNKNKTVVVEMGLKKLEAEVIPPSYVLPRGK